MLDDGTIERFAELGITAVVQPINLRSESHWLADAGRAPSGWTAPTRSVACSTPGVPVAGSSDAPIEATDVLAAMAAAVDRPELAPDQAITGGRGPRPLHHRRLRGPAAPRTDSVAWPPACGPTSSCSTGDPPDHPPPPARVQRRHRGGPVIGRPSCSAARPAPPLTIPEPHL